MEEIHSGYTAKMEIITLFSMILILVQLQILSQTKMLPV